MNHRLLLNFYDTVRYRIVFVNETEEKDCNKLKRIGFDV